MNKEYLPHIDILRAIAVFLVIFHHLDITLFSGGFIGVDIFFVISGYLITKNIQQDVRQNKFSLLSFYQRRVMRLAPAFFTMLICCSFAFWIFSTAIPSELDNYFKSLIAAVCLFINIYLWQSLSDYFSINASITPLLHIWSLSLEEQFYLLWPTLFLIFTKFHYRIKTIFFIIIFTISFIYSYYSAIESPISAYYLLLSRIFEFMIGAFIITLPKIKIKKIKKLLFTTFILFIIFYLSITLNKESIFPSYNALIICCASAIYIYIAKIDAQTKYWQPLLYLGKISYPMYLWHWPIIVAFNIHSIILNEKIKLIVIITTLILACLTYEKIEKPAQIYMKNHKNIIKKFFILPSLILILFSITIIQLYKQKVITPAQALAMQDLSKCLDSSVNNPSCFIGLQQSNKVDLLLVGDSHAHSQIPIIDILSKDINILGYAFTQSTTMFLPDTDCIRTDKSKDSEEWWKSRFKNRNIEIEQIIKNNRYRFVVMGGYYTMDYCIFSNKHQKNSILAFNEGIEKAIKIILKFGATPVIMQDNPQLYDVDINCNLRTDMPEQKCRYNSALHFSATKNWNTQLRYLKQKYPQIIIIDFTNIICQEKFCYSYIDNTPLYRDNHHITHEGAYQIGKHYLQIYGNPLKSHEK